MFLHGSHFFQSKAEGVDHEQTFGKVDSIQLVHLYRHDEENEHDEEVGILQNGSNGGYFESIMIQKRSFVWVVKVDGSTFVGLVEVELTNDCMRKTQLTSDNIEWLL